MRRLNTQKGFSLTEMIVGSIIVAIVSAIGYSAVRGLSRADEITENRIAAVNLLQKSQEAIRAVAQTNYDNLGPNGAVCDFTPNDTCGFDNDLTADYPIFTRTLTVQDATGTTELKNVFVSVSWTEFNPQTGAAVNKSLDSVTYISRPPDPLPGNIAGRVLGPDGPISGVTITATRINPSTGEKLESELRTSETPGVTSGGGNNNVNYDFSSPERNRAGFRLQPAVNWLVQATDENFTQNPSEGITAQVSSGEERLVPINMIPNPENGTITVNIDNIGVPATFKDFLSSSSVALYQNGTQIERQGSGGSSFTFEVEFEDEKKRCFTVATHDAYKSGLAGSFPNCAAQSQTTNNPDGWSSAVFVNGSANCANTWEGNSDIDTVCVNPGKNEIVGVRLVDVPTAKLEGDFKDSKGRVLDSSDYNFARVYIRPYASKEKLRWTGSSAFTYKKSGYYYSKKIKGKGVYSIDIPAKHSLFPPDSKDKFSAEGMINVPQTECCNKDGSQPIWTGWKTITTSIKSEGKYQKDFIFKNLTAKNIECGNIKGKVYDGKNKTPLSNATVVFQKGITSKGDGGYKYLCKDPKLLPIEFKKYSYTASKKDNKKKDNKKKDIYYPFKSGGNNIYTAHKPVKLKVDSITIKTAPDIYLWPIKTGEVKVTVKDTNGNDLSGASVKLTGPKNTSGSTGSNGIKTLKNVQESWPAPGAVGKSQYNQKKSNYTVNVSLDNYKSYKKTGIVVKAGNRTEVEATLIYNGSGGM